MKPLVDRVSEFLETETDGFLQAYSNFDPTNINLLDKDKIVDSYGKMKSYGSTNRTFQTYTADESGRGSTALGFFYKNCKYTNECAFDTKPCWTRKRLLFRLDS